MTRSCSVASSRPPPPRTSRNSTAHSLDRSACGGIPGGPRPQRRKGRRSGREGKETIHRGVLVNRRGNSAEATRPSGRVEEFQVRDHRKRVGVWEVGGFFVQ